MAESLPELGPVTATVRLSREDGAYRFDDLNVTLGKTDALRVEVTGTLGALQPEADVALEEIALAVSFAAALVAGAIPALVASGVSPEDLRAGRGTSAGGAR